MKQYIYNVWMSLLGRDPYGKELDVLRNTVAEQKGHIAGMNDLYHKLVDGYDSASRKVTELEALIADGKKRESSLQRLVESLRQRIAEYQQRIKEYNEEIDRLR